MEEQTENRLMEMGKGEERVRCMERVTWKLTLPYVKYIANRNLLPQETQTGVCINLEMWDGREVQKGGDICIAMADSC